MFEKIILTIFFIIMSILFVFLISMAIYLFYIVIIDFKESFFSGLFDLIFYYPILIFILKIVYKGIMMLYSKLTYKNI